MSQFQPTPEQIKTFLTNHFEVKPRKNGTELRICNPFTDDDGFKFSVNVNNGLAHCWTGDEWAGQASSTGKRNQSFVHFVSLYLKCTHREAIKAITAGEATPTYTKHKDEKPKQPVVSIALPAGSQLLDDSSKISRILLNWVASRGLTYERVKQLKLMRTEVEVIWPYFEYDELVYWQLRHFVDKRFRFPSEEEYGVSKTQFFYNFDNIEPTGEVAITEAIFDCLSIEQCLASGGADLGAVQLRKLKLLNTSKYVILAPDNDGPGVMSVINNGKRLTEHGFKVAFSIPPAIEYKSSDGLTKTTKDWNDIGRYATGFGRPVSDMMWNNVKLYTLTEKIRLSALAQRLIDAKKRDGLPNLYGVK